MLATPLANSAIARNRALQNQLNIITASEERTEQRQMNDDSEQQRAIEILETSDTLEVSIKYSRVT